MKKIVSGAIVSLFVMTSQVFALDASAEGVYQMTWGNGKTGTYTVSDVTAKSAKVTYSYGGKSKTKTLKVRKNQIKGGGWFPTLKIGSGGGASASHGGSSAQVSKN